jgi:methyl-accepting chemotaxis protein
MPPDSLDVDPTTLPRSFHGYDPEATEELFKRVAWDYGLLAGEHRKLKKSLEDAQPTSRPAAGDVDSVARSLLATVQKVVREMRESAREDCERAIRKATKRAAEIEDEAKRASANATAILEAASELRSSLQEALESLERGEPVVSQASANASRRPWIAPVSASQRR